MVAAVGLGGYVAGIFHLVTHAFFKALLFLGSGSVIHSIQYDLEHSTHPDTLDESNSGSATSDVPDPRDPVSC